MTPDRFVYFRGQLLMASDANVRTMRRKLLAVPAIEKPDIAHLAAMMIRQANKDGALGGPLRADIEDAVAMLVVLGVSRVHD
jgi:hypothetical protein